MNRITFSQLQTAYDEGAILVPCNAEGHPVRKGWLKRRWAPDIVPPRMGLVPGSLGYAVFDLDVKDRPEAERAPVLTKRGDLVCAVLGRPSFWVKTGSGGAHFYYRLEDGDRPELRNAKAYVDGAPSDIRCDRGFVYLWGDALEHALEDHIPLHSRQQLLDLLKAFEKKPFSTVEGALQDVLGNRNDNLYKRVTAAEANDTDPEPAIKQAIEMAETSGLPQDEIDRTVASGRKSGAKIKATTPRKPKAVHSHLELAQEFDALGLAAPWRWVDGMEEWRWWDGSWSTGRQDRLLGELLRLGAETINKKRVVDGNLVSVPNHNARGNTPFAVNARVALRDLCFTTPDEWNSDPVWIGVRGGKMLNLETHEVRDAAPSDLSTRQIACLPGSEGRELWRRFLEETIPDDEERMFFLDMCALCLSGRAVDLQRVVLLLGPEASGKSLLLEIVMEAMGDFAANAPTALVFETGLKGTAFRLDTAVAQIADTRFVRVADPKSGGVEGWSDVFKAVTGDDHVQARQANKMWAARRTWCLFLALNEMPDCYSGSDSRRLAVVQCPRHHTGIGAEGFRTADPELKAKLRQALPAIVFDLLNGCQRPMPPIPEATIELTKVEAPRGDFRHFAAQRLIPVEGSWEFKDDVRAAYARWQQEKSDQRRKLSDTALTKRMSDLGYRSSRVRHGDERVRVYLDCRLS